MLIRKERVEELKGILTIQCGNIIYTPEMYLKNETVPMIQVVYLIYGKHYTFTIPVFLFESTNRFTEGRVEELVSEIKRNVELAHKREELI